MKFLLLSFVRMKILNLDCKDLKDIFDISPIFYHCKTNLSNIIKKIFY